MRSKAVWLSAFAKILQTFIEYAQVGEPNSRSTRRREEEPIAVNGRCVGGPCSPLRGVGLAAGAEDLVGGAEDSLAGALGDRLAFAPFLNVASAELRAGKAQGFAAKKRDGLSFDFSHVAWRDLGFGEILFVTVPENHVTEFVEERFVRRRRYGAHRNLAPRLGVTLRVAVKHREIDPLDVEDNECHFLVPLRLWPDVVPFIRARRGWLNE